MAKTHLRKKNLLAAVEIGLTCAVFLILLNPSVCKVRSEIITEASNPAETFESFFIEIPADGIAITHNGEMILAAFPAGIPFFSEPNIKTSLAVLAKVRNADGHIIGFASELEVFPEADFSQGDIIWDTDWTVVIPGRGTLFLHQKEHAGELFPKVLKPTMDTGRDWEGDWTVTTTVGPRADGRGMIVGGTGEFNNAKGSFFEIDRLTKYTTERHLFARVELRVFREKSK